MGRNGRDRGIPCELVCRLLALLLTMVSLGGSAQARSETEASADAGKPTRVESTGLLLPDTQWETRWFQIDSGEEGPTILITGGVHGNEPAGAHAAEQIRTWPIQRGRVIVIPQVNRLGLRANTRWIPAHRNDKSLRDANRNFPYSEGPDAPQTELCCAVWEFVESIRPDWVIDLHEGFDFNRENSKSVGSSLIYFGSETMDPLADSLQAVVNGTVSNADRHFVLLRRGPVAGSLVRAAVEKLDSQGFIFETTTRDQPLSTRVRQHRILVANLLRHLNVIDGDWEHWVLPIATSSVRHIGIYDGPGTGGSGVKNVLGLLQQDPRYAPHCLGPEDLQAARLAGFAALVFPGGSGSKQAAAIGEGGRERIREFTRAGGGYLGICAGAYLCSAHYSWSLNLVDTRVFTGSRDIPGVGKKQMWYRGKSATVEMELTPEGKAILGEWPEPVKVIYHNGPIVSPAGKSELPTYVPLARFRTEVGLWEPQEGTMIQTPAMVASHFGDGRVLAISPHPEAGAETSGIVVRAIDWLCGEPLSSPVEPESVPKDDKVSPAVKVPSNR